MTREQKYVVAIAILASFITFLDSAVVHVALPVIEHELGGGLALQQWVVDGYSLTLAAFILLAGSISDLFGRLRVMRWGLVGFALASILCAIAPNAWLLIAARILQGAAGAVLIPSALALIADRVRGKSFGPAVGLWTSWTSMAFLAGPLLGGFFVDVLSWRLIFAINIIPIALALWGMSHLRHDTSRSKNETHLDIQGAILGITALGSIVLALIEQPQRGWSSPIVVGLFTVGALALGEFIRYEKHCRAPLIPRRLFRHRNFTFGNLSTLAVYAGVAVVNFVLVLYLQQVAHYSALMSGMSLVPITIVLFVASSRFGALSQKYGPRIFMTIGPLIMAAGMTLLALNIAPPITYMQDILPGVLIFGIGLAATVTPLTVAVLANIKTSEEGIASAVNNAVSRVAGLVAIAAIGVVMSAHFNAVIDKRSEDAPLFAQNQLQEARSEVWQVNSSDFEATQQIVAEASTRSFRTSMLVTAGVIAAGGVIAWVGIRNPAHRSQAST